MAHWRVTAGDRQFLAEDLDELKKLASQGKIGPGDMIQPPGASDWLYASELPELQNLLSSSSSRDPDDDLDTPRKTGVTIAIIAVLAIGAVIAGGVMWYFGAMLDDAQNLDLDLSLSEMIATADTPIRAEPNTSGTSVGTLAQNEKGQLLAKRRDWFEIQTAGGTKGWVPVDAIVPAYYFADSQTKEDYDPIYNPDSYLFVKNSSWMQMPQQKELNITLFQFLLQNKSKFAMEDVILLAKITDENDKDLETAEIAIEGTITPYDAFMVGTLLPPDGDESTPPRVMTENLFAELVAKDPELNSRWTMGVEVGMKTQRYKEATIELLQVHAVPRKID